MSNAEGSENQQLRKAALRLSEITSAAAMSEGVAFELIID
jgi:hypothetical protein